MDGNTINRFVKGIVSDQDMSDVESSAMVFPTLNCRIYNKKGQGWIATSLESNELAFSLSEGFVAITAQEFNGILYIVSVKEELINGNVRGYCELGTFPSPAKLAFNNTSYNAHVSLSAFFTGFTSEYKSFANLSRSGVRSRFRIDYSNDGEYLNWTDDNLVDLKIKDSYDGSVDLYLVDDTNPNKVINSGFDQEGEFTDRQYSLSQLEGYSDLIPSTDSPMTATLTAVELGGDLSPANYWIFFRYSTSGFASTQFCSEIGPIQIAVGSLSLDTQGMQEKDWLFNTSNKANKKIKIALSDIDTSYDYIQVGVLRYSAFTENGKATTDTYLINDYFKIDGATLDLEILGTESEAILTMDEISEGTIPYNICKTQHILNNRFLGVAWKREHSYSDELRVHLAAFAQAIELTHDTCGGLEVGGNDTANTGVLQQYKDPIKTEGQLGYFKGEVYPYAVKYKFSNGYISEAFPCKSFDAMGLHTVTDADKLKGLFRFPDYETLYPVTVPPTNLSMSEVLLIHFDVTDALAYKNANLSEFGDIIGFYFVRGDRIENMIGQGVLTNVIDHARVRSNQAGAVPVPYPVTTRYFDGDDGTDSGSAKLIPCVKHIYDANPPVYNNAIRPPYGLRDDVGTYTYGAGVITLSSVQESKFALFCPDFIFTDDVINEGDTYYMKLTRLGNPVQGYSSSGWQPDAIDIHETAWDSEIYRLPVSECSLTNVGTGVTSSGGKFVSLLRDGYAFKNSPDKGFYVADGETSYPEDYFYNRSMASQKYIGVTDINNNFLVANDSRLNIVSIYKLENTATYFEDILASFNVSSEKYSTISKFIPLTATQSDYDIYKGDCFWQKTYVRPMRWFGRDGNSEKDDSTGKPYEYGMVVGFWSENKVNTAMRNEVRFIGTNNAEGVYTYYPKLLTKGESLVGWLGSSSESSQVEAVQVNDGYSRNMSPVQVVGYDNTITLADVIKKNRIYFSDKQVAGSQIDSFRNIGIYNYRDFILDNNEFTTIAIYNNAILGILRNALIEIYADERVLQGQSSGQDVILAPTDFLSDRTRIVENYGCQQVRAVLVTPNGVYGYDYIKKVIWRVVSRTTDYGSTRLVAENLSNGRFVSSTLEEWFESLVTVTDITETVVDNPILFDGVHIGYNQNSNEVLFTFMSGSTLLKTLVFDEDLVFDKSPGAFTGEYTTTPVLWASINNDLYSAKPDTVGLVSTGDFYRHNVVDKYLKFYGVFADFKLSFIVNASQSEKGFGQMVKIFEGLQVEMPEVEITTMLYETEYQSGSYSFNTMSVEDGSEDGSEYEDNAWKIPIIVQTSAVEQQFDEDSELTGRWLKVTIQYTPTTEAQQIWIKKVITNFSIIQ